MQVFTCIHHGLQSVLFCHACPLTGVDLPLYFAGLLLNHLSVYHGCEIVFDSSEVPDQAMSAATDVPDVQVCSSEFHAVSC